MQGVKSQAQPLAVLAAAHGSAALDFSVLRPHGAYHAPRRWPQVLLSYRRSQPASDPTAQPCVHGHQQGCKHKTNKRVCEGG